MIVPTMEQVLELVDFGEDTFGRIAVMRVKTEVRGHVLGSVEGDVLGNIDGDMWGTIYGDVRGSVKGSVWGVVKGGVMGEWQPIETVPKEGLVLLYGGSPDDFDDKYVVAYWNSVEKEWNTTAPPFRLDFTPTHWHPIPQPPEENK